MGQLSRKHGRLRAAAVTSTGLIGISLALTGGLAATAGGPPVFRQSNGVVAIDGQSLAISYRGRNITEERLKKLNHAGKAMVSINNRELACQGRSLYVDTQKEFDVYRAGFDMRETLRRQTTGVGTAAEAPTAADICATYR